MWRSLEDEKGALQHSSFQEILNKHMKTLLRYDIPEDFIYYRTGSEIFYDYSQEFYW